MLSADDNWLVELDTEDVRWVSVHEGPTLDITKLETWSGKGRDLRERIRKAKKTAPRGFTVVAISDKDPGRKQRSWGTAPSQPRKMEQDLDEIQRRSHEYGF